MVTGMMKFRTARRARAKKPKLLHGSKFDPTRSPGFESDLVRNRTAAKSLEWPSLLAGLVVGEEVLLRVGMSSVRPFFERFSGFRTISGASDFILSYGSRFSRVEAGHNPKLRDG